MSERGTKELRLLAITTQCGYNTLLASVNEPTVKAIKRAADDLWSHGVEGIILNVPTAVDLTSLQAAFGNTPYVVTDAGAGNNVTMVTTDHEYGACLSRVFTATNP